MKFGEAIEAMKKGKRVTRKGWNGKGMYLEMQNPDDHSKMTRSYIYMKTVNDEFVPWVASQSDIIEEDWEIVLEEMYITLDDFLAMHPHEILSIIEEYQNDMKKLTFVSGDKKFKLRELTIDQRMHNVDSFNFVFDEIGAPSKIEITIGR